MYVTEINRDEFAEKGCITVTFNIGPCIRYYNTVKCHMSSTYIRHRGFINREIRKNFSYFGIMKPWMTYFRDDKYYIDTLSDEQLSRLSVVLFTVHDRISSLDAYTNFEEFGGKTYVTGNGLSGNKLDDDLVLYVDHIDADMCIMKHGQHVSDVCYMGSDGIEWNERYKTLSSIRCWDEVMAGMLSGNKQQLLIPFYRVIKEIEEVYDADIVDTKSAKC